MSSSNSTNSANNSSNNYQYASSAPSISSILNLPQVEDKKKPAVSSGLAKKQPVGALGLAAPSTNGKGMLGTLKLLPKTSKGQSSVENVSTLVSTLEIKEPEPKNDAKESSVMKVKVEKTKSHTQSQNQRLQSSVNNLNKSKKLSHIKPSEQTAHTAPDFDPAHWRLFVGNLGPEVTDALLLSTFQNPFPSCSKALIVRDWKTRKPKGYAFVAFADGKEFLRALKEMQGKWIGTRQCIIKSEQQPKFN